MQSSLRSSCPAGRPRATCSPARSCRQRASAASAASLTERACPTDMPVAKVHRISAAAPDDVSGIEAAIAAGRIDPAGVIAVLGKTEGNGLVNDFSRGFANLQLNLLFRRFLPGEDATRICLVMSGGTEGAMAPHWVVFERSNAATGQRPALAIGRAHTAALPFRQLGRAGQVDAVATGGRAANGDAGAAHPPERH